MKPKLIILYGFASSGKTTIATKYSDEHSLILNLEGDRIIVMLGQWMQYEDEARESVFLLTKSMINTHLHNKKTVLLPYLLMNPKHAEEFEHIANENQADFYEIFLSVEKDDAINRLMERGTWGEEGLPSLTQRDLPTINKIFDQMTESMSKRNKIISIHSHKNEIDKTYQAFLEAIGEI